MTTADWAEIYWIIERSTLVDDDLFAVFQAYEKACPNSKISLPPFVIPEDTKKSYSTYSFPATEQPEILCSYYESGFCDAEDTETERKFIHDLVLYGMPSGLDKHQFMKTLSTSFSEQPFIQDLVAYIQMEKTLRFGAMNDWIHSHCSDVPLPYRWEIKENTRILYNWLAFFFDNIEWSIPGSHSQVIFWRD